MIDKILSRREFVDRPPVLLDIGASGAMHHKWRDIARYSIGISFDADARDMGYAAGAASGFKKYYVYNRLVTDRPSPVADFYLTRSPHCSSLLTPDQESLNKWAFAELFDVERVVTVVTMTLADVMNEAGIDKIDWFKTDSQGTDLRLFVSLGEELMDRVLVAEFEPGIIDAYKGEDKLWSLLAYMDKRPFWLNSLVVRGTERIERNVYAERSRRVGNGERQLQPLLLPTSPCWGEVSYLNTFDGELEKRDFLLGWVFAMIEHQLGFAFELAIKGGRRFGDAVFEEMAEYSLASMSSEPSRLPAVVGKILGTMKRIFA